MTKGIILDYGGTIDSRGTHWSEVIWQAYQNAGINIDKAEFRNSYVTAERELARVRHILPHHNFHDLMLIKMRIELADLISRGLLPASFPLQDKAAETALSCYQAARQCIDEARPTLDWLHQRYPMVLVSNFYGNVESVLQDFSLRHYFRQIIESAVVGVRKPDPRIFALGVQALGMQPDQVLVIGDSFRKDIQPALTLGCRVLWLKGKGWTAEEDAITHPSMITSLSQIPQRLNEQ